MCSSDLEVVSRDIGVNTELFGQHVGRRPRVRPNKEVDLAAGFVTEGGRQSSQLVREVISVER